MIFIKFFMSFSIVLLISSLMIFVLYPFSILPYGLFLIILGSVFCLAVLLVLISDKLIQWSLRAKLVRGVPKKSIFTGRFQVNGLYPPRIFVTKMTPGVIIPLKDARNQNIVIIGSEMFERLDSYSSAMVADYICDIYKSNNIRFRTYVFFSLNFFGQLFSLIKIPFLKTYFIDVLQAPLVTLEKSINKLYCSKFDHFSKKLGDFLFLRERYNSLRTTYQSLDVVDYLKQ